MRRIARYIIYTSQEFFFDIMRSSQNVKNADYIEMIQCVCVAKKKKQLFAITNINNLWITYIFKFATYLFDNKIKPQKCLSRVKPYIKKIVYSFG